MGMRPVAKLVLPPHFRETMLAFERMLDDDDINKETVELLISMYTQAALYYDTVEEDKKSGDRYRMKIPEVFVHAKVLRLYM